MSGPARCPSCGDPVSLRGLALLGTIIGAKCRGCGTRLTLDKVNWPWNATALAPAAVIAWVVTYHLHFQQTAVAWAFGLVAFAVLAVPLLMLLYRRLARKHGLVPTAGSEPLRWQRILVEVIWVAVFTMVVGAIDTIPVAKGFSETCILCRMYRVRYEVPCSGFSRYCETVCSRYYSREVEPVHEHVWVGYPGWTGYNVFGMGIMVASRNIMVPILHIAPDSQMAVYQHLPDKQAAKGIFLTFSGEHKSTWGESRRVADALRQWADADFAGKWEDYVLKAP
jgi:hypothetical protein